LKAVERLNFVNFLANFSIINLAMAFEGIYNGREEAVSKGRMNQTDDSEKRGIEKGRSGFNGAAHLNRRRAKGRDLAGES
jgi:hypothetical protein